MTTTLDRWDILISHHINDLDQIKSLEEQLLFQYPRELKLLLDSWSNRPGETLSIAIEDQVQLIRYVLLAISPDVLEGGWEYLHRIIEETRRYKIKAGKLLVACIKISPEDIPSPLRSYPIFDLRDGYTYEREFFRLLGLLIKPDIYELPEKNIFPDPLSQEETDTKEKPSYTLPLPASGSWNDETIELRETLAKFQLETIDYYKHGEVSLAKSSIEQAYTAAESLYGKNHPTTATMLNNLAMLELESGNVERARELLETSLRQMEKELGGIHRTVIETLSNLAAVCHAQNDLLVARNYMERAVSAGIMLLGFDSQDLAPLFHRLAVIAAEQGDLETAQVSHERALKIRESFLGSDHIETANSHDGLGAIAYLKERYDVAREHTERAYRIRAQILGETHPLTLSTREHLARIAKFQGDYPTAHHLLLGLLTILEEQFGENEPQLAETIDALAAISYKLGDLSSSYRLVDRARRLKELNKDLPDSAIAESLYHQARVARDLGDHNASRRHLLQAVSVLESSDSDKVLLAAILNDLGLCYLEFGDLESARSPLERALNIWENCEDPSMKKHAATALHNLAALAYAQGDRHLAIKLQRQAKTMEEESK